MGGIRDIERYGFGSREGGRGANARAWLPQGNGTATAQEGSSRQVASNIPPVNGAGGLEQNQGGATFRKQPMTDEIQRQLVAAGATAAVNVEVTSCGQSEDGPDHHGRHRHDHGRSADLRLYRLEDGKRRDLSMLNDADRAVMEKFIRSSVAAGAAGVGAHPNYMGPEKLHIGGGSPAA